MDTFLRGGMSCDVWLFSLNFPPGVWVPGGLKYCQHILWRNSYLYLSFAFVNNIVPKTTLHWTQIVAINAASINTDKRRSLFTKFIRVILCIYFFSFYFCKIIGANTTAHLSMKLLYLKKCHSIIESNQLSKSFSWKNTHAHKLIFFNVCFIKVIPVNFLKENKNWIKTIWYKLSKLW